MGSDLCNHNSYHQATSRSVFILPANFSCEQTAQLFFFPFLVERTPDQTREHWNILDGYISLMGARLSKVDFTGCLKTGKVMEFRLLWKSHGKSLKMSKNLEKSWNHMISFGEIIIFVC